MYLFLSPFSRARTPINGAKFWGEAIHTINDIYNVQTNAG